MGKRIADRTIAAALLGGCILPAAQAGDWQTSNSIDVQLTYTDNLELTTDADPGFIASVRPSITVRGEGARLRGGLSYQPVLFGYLGSDDGDPGMNHHLAADFNATLVERTLFLDATASAGLATTSTTPDYGRDGLNLGNQADQIYTYALSPYSLHRFGSYATLRVGANVDQVVNGESDGQLDSTGAGLSAILSSGTRFNRFPWSISANYSLEEFEDRTDHMSQIRGTAGYRIDRQWLVNASLGYQDNDLVTSRDETDGVTYSGSVTWTPSPRTTASAEVGGQYFGTFWNLSLDQRSKRTRWSLEYRRDVTNARREALGISFVEQQTESGETVLVPIFVLSPVDENYLSDRLTGTVTLTGKRTNVTLQLGLDQREYEVTLANERVYSARANLLRRITPRLSAGLTASWQDINTDLGADSEITDIGLNLTSSIGRYSSLTGEVSHRQHDEVGADYRENRIGVTFSTRMF